MNRRGYRKCPACAEWIRKEAAICRFCRAILGDGPLPAFAPPKAITPPEAITPEAAGDPASAAASSRSALFRGIDHRFANHNVRLSTRQREAIVAFLNESRNQFCEATVLFMDIKGFTTLVQNAKTEEVEQFLHAYYSIIVSTVEFYNGFVVEFQGDGGHAVFGAPRAYERDAEAAVRAALDIRERVRVLPPVDGYKIQVSCGLATGRVLSSIVHLPTETHYKIYGHAVNLSARVQSAAQPDTVLTDPGTHSLTENRFDFEVLPKRRFKNVAKPIHTYVVKGIRSHPEPPPPAFPFVGREAELQSLGEAWNRFQEQSQAGVPEPRHRGVFIKGPAGIGKTRLAMEFAGSRFDRGRPANSASPVSTCKNG